MAKPTRSDPSRAGPLFLTVSLSGTDAAKPSPNHFFQGDHVYESPPSLFRARNPLPRYLYLTQRGLSRVCSRRTHSAIAPATQTKCHKRFTSQPAIGSGVCAWGGGGSRPLPPNPPPPLKPSQAKPSQARPGQAKPGQASLKAALFISQAPRLNLPNSPPSQAKPTRSDPSRAGPLSLQTIFFKATMYMKVHHRCSAHETHRHGIFI